MNIKFSSSRIENLFGLYKQNYGHTPRSLIHMIREICNLSNLLVTQSINGQQNTFKQYQNFSIIIPNDLKYFGKFALEELWKEYNAWSNGENKDPLHCVWCCLRNMNSLYTLPYRHIINDKTLLNANLLHPRYIRDQTFEMDEYSRVRIVAQKRQKPQYCYSSIMERIAPFANEAEKNVHLQEIFAKTFQELDNSKVEINENIPKKLLTKGRPFVTPSSNVMHGHIKKGHCCSICGELGHNKQSCQKKK